MGTCQSTTSHVDGPATTAPVKNPLKQEDVAKPPPPVEEWSQKLNDLDALPSKKSKEENLKDPNAPEAAPGSCDSEECDDTASSSYRTHTEPLSPGFSRRDRERDEQARHSRRVEVRRVRPGYSSGGSSDYSDDTSDESGRENSVHNHLKDWKVELSDGDLCKGVVHIETDFGRPIDEVYEGVHDGEIMGSGVAGVVRKVKHRKTGVKYAVKCLDIGLIRDANGLQALREEIFIMCQLDHPNIVRLEEVYESENEIYLIQELCQGGDLFDRLDDQSDFHYSEAKCARLVKQMLSSVRYLHSKKIIHRDLKLENFLFSNRHPDSELKMIDFGLSKHFTYAGEIQHECVGTPYTVAPEIIRAQYDEKVDIWALGVITYLLLCGETPFGGSNEGESLIEVRNNILRGNCPFEPEDVWEHVSEAGKNFVKRLLNPVAANRPTAKEAQFDPWLQTYAKKGATFDSSLSPQLAQSLVRFKEYSNMRRVLCEVLSFTLLPEQIADLRTEFEKVDPEGEGEVSLTVLKQVLMQSAEQGALGALDECEVEEIFNAIRVRKNEATIRWHEFIAAGLSQCNFDERNLKLAFERLDCDRKGFITIDDMKELIGGSGGEDDDAIIKMWEDGIVECACPMGRITYDDFRMFVKGQTKEREPREPGTPKRKSLRLSLEKSPSLQSVPEGSISPQAKHKVFPRFDELSAMESLKMPMLGGMSMSVPELLPPPILHADIGFPPEMPMACHRRVRSRSLGEQPIIEATDSEDDEDDARLRSTFTVLPSKAIEELKDIRDGATTPLAFNRALYRKHREFRQSVLEASKLFDHKQKKRKLDIAAKAPLRGSTLEHRPSLVMRRGSRTNKGGLGVSTTHARMEQPSSLVDPLPTKSEHDQTKKVDDAAKRSGRPRRPRQKTTSDLSGMLR